MKRTLWLVLCGISMAFPLHAQRLPKNVTPVSYDLTFTPDLAKADFVGDETIHVVFKEPSKTVVLNSAEIDFQSATIATGRNTQKASVQTDEKMEQVTLTVPNAIPAGPAEIHVQFHGILNDKLRGFYLSKTERRRYAVTQFEATDARRAFPSFDEPFFKAVFNITLIVDATDTAISNGSIISETPGPGAKHTLKFSPSPKMSTYLVAMIVGDFQCQSGSADDIPIRVCAVPEKKDLVGYSVSATEKIVRYYDRYYYTKYPFQKLDIVAFPDFSAGAMENTGAITYRETLLLIDDKIASLDSHELVASVLAHEIAHQWFGDLVTMQWWDNVWLNEGFATWMSWKPLKDSNPEWHTELAEIQETTGSLDTDSIASIRPIRADAKTPEEIANLFDGIAYGKAASVLRMVEAYLGPESFREGVNAYLKAHAYANATAQDFWVQVAVTAGKPVDAIMSSFIDQPGAPLVSVETGCHDGRTSVTLAQTRYFSNAAAAAKGSPEIWTIPIFLRAFGSTQSSVVLLNKRKQTFELQGCSPWVNANAGGRGYYRTEYSPAAYAEMSKEIETSFSSEERIRFLDDAWALVRIGRLNIGEYLATLTHMQGERSRAVVGTMLEHIPEIHDNLTTAENRPAFEARVREFLRPMAADLADDSGAGQATDRAAFQADVFAALAVYGSDRKMIQQAVTNAEAFVKEGQSTNRSWALQSLTIAARNGDANLYQKYRQQMKAARTPEQYYPYFFAIAFFREPELIKRNFDFALSPDVRNQDMAILGRMIANPETRSVAWELYKNDFKEIQAKLGESLGDGSLAFLTGFCDPQTRDQSQEFFKAQDIPGIERTLQNARDQADACIELRSLQGQNLAAYLKQ